MLSDDIAVKLLNVVLYRELWRVERLNERRPFSALSFRISSTARFSVGGKVIEAPAGSISFVPEDVEYRRESDHEELLVFHFSLYNCVDKRIQVFQPEDPEKYRVLFERARDIWEAHEVGYRYRATSIFYEILYEMERDGALQHQSQTRFLIEAERYMNLEHADPSLSIADLARRAGVSEAYFRRTFREQYGVSPKQYLLTLRMQHAISLIHAGEHSQAEVAGLTGFRDVKYFRAAFKSYIGKSVRDYRDNPDYIDGMQGYRSKNKADM